MTQEESEKKAKRNAAARLNYWADRRLKDIIRRRAQVESWVETYDFVLGEKEAKASKSVRRVARQIETESRAA